MAMLLTVKELAGEAGISRQALEKHLGAGHIEADFTAGGRKLVRHESAAVLRQYTHLTTDDKRAAMQRLPDVTDG